MKTCRLILHILLLLIVFSLFACTDSSPSSEYEKPKSVVKKKGIPQLLVELGDRNPNVRRVAAGSLAAMGEKSIPALVEALGDENRLVRDGSADALAQIGKDAVPHLIIAFESEKKWGGFFAAMALREIGSDAKEAIPALKKARKKARKKDCSECA